MTQPTDRAAVDQLVADFATERHCPSVAWGIVRDGVLVEHGAFGSVNGTVPTDRTVYRIASMTKSFSAAITLLLRDDGVLALDDPLGRHAPELADLRSPTGDAPAITIRDLLCMSSGLVSDDPWADRHLDLTDDEFDQLVRDGLVFAGPTGACHEYSNFGYALLGRVIHRATGTRLRQHVTERLLEPLGMSRTTWDRPDHDEWARPMRWLDERFVEEIPTPADGMIAPMGGIWTTVADLATWSSWLASAFPARDDPDTGPLRRSSRREMQTPQRYSGQRALRGVRFPSSYGYGLRILDEPDHGTVISHSGGLPGYGSNMRWTPGGRLGIVTLSNVTYAPMTELGARLHDLLRSEDATGTLERPVPRQLTDLATELLRVLDGWCAGEHPSDAELDAVFADNVAPDDAYDRRAARATEHGPLTTGDLTATSDAAGRIEVTASDGRTGTITFSLAPHLPPRVQDYAVELPGPAHTTSGDRCDPS